MSGGRCPGPSRSLCSEGTGRITDAESSPQCPSEHSEAGVTAVNEAAARTATALTSQRHKANARDGGGEGQGRGEGVARLLPHLGPWAACRLQCLQREVFPFSPEKLGDTDLENRLSPTIVFVFGGRKRPRAVTHHRVWGTAWRHNDALSHLLQSSPAAPVTRTVSENVVFLI